MQDSTKTRLKYKSRRDQMIKRDRKIDSKNPTDM